MAYIGQSFNSLSPFQDIDKRYLRNRIVNPAMSISQERVQVLTPKQTYSRLRMTVTTAKASLGTTDFLQIRQKIEGLSISDYAFGTASAKQLLLRFGFKAPIGTYSFKINNSAADRSYVGQINVTNTNDNYYQFIIPGDTTGTWLIDNNIGIDFGIQLAAGSSFNGTANAWQAGTFLSFSGSTNGMSSTSNVFELYDVELYVDSLGNGVFPEWEFPAYEAELRKCRRYWETGGFNSSGTVPAGGNGTGYVQPFLASKAISPTMIASNIASTNVTGNTINAVNIDGFFIYSVGVAAGGFYWAGTYTAVARL